MQSTTFYLLLALLAAITLLIIIYWLRQRLTGMTVKKNAEGFAVDLQASEPASPNPAPATRTRPRPPTTTFSGNKQTGNKNSMTASGPGQFTENTQDGDENEMSMGSTPPKK